MIRSSREIKRISRDMLNNRYQIPMGAFIVAGFLPAILEIPFSMSIGEYPSITQLAILRVAEFIIFLINLVFCIGVSYLHLNLTRGKDFRLANVFAPFRQRTERFFGAAVLFGVPALILSLPAILCMYRFDEETLTASSVAILAGAFLFSLVTVLAFALNYMFAAFFLLDSAELTVIAAFRESRLMMKRRKLRLLYLLCSFLGWGALTFFSFGVAALWIAPYLNQVLVTFYLDCTGELDRIPIRDYGQTRAAF